MKRFKRKQKKLKEKQTARLIAESPLTCALDIWQARKEARAKAEYALSHEDFLMAEADLVHHLNRLKASTGLDEKKSELVEEQKETQALREFFEGCNGFGWLRRDGWVGRAQAKKKRAVPFFALDCQYWEGVSIKRWERRVGGLVLERNNLEGELPTDALVKLISLDTLILPGNDVFGTLQGLGQLTALTDLDLAENRFTGEVPSELGEVNQLTHVNLSNNELEGQLPASLQNLSQLRVLQLRANALEGPIPEEYATLTHLEDLDLAENRFVGGLDWASSLVKLTQLDCSRNFFSGPLPILPATLITLDLGVNGLQGPFSNDFCERHTALQTCILRENRLGGALPEKLGLLINLKQLDLSHNRFVKFLPESCTSLKELRCCDFQGNAIEMIHYPQGLEDMEHLQYWFGADGFYSQSLQRPKRYEKSKFKAMLRFQKLYAGEPILKAQAPVDPNSEDPRTMGQLPPHPPLHMTKFGKFERGEEVPDNVLPGSHSSLPPEGVFVDAEGTVFPPGYVHLGLPGTSHEIGPRDHEGRTQS